MPTRKRQRRLPSAKAGPPKLLPPCSEGEAKAVDEVAEWEQFFRRWKAEGKPLALFLLTFHKVHENDGEFKTTLRLEGDDLVFRAVFPERLLGPLLSFRETTRSTPETEGNDAPRGDDNDEPSEPGNPDPCTFGPS